jgi:hypothetical protein
MGIVARDLEDLAGGYGEIQITTFSRRDQATGLDGGFGL